MKFKKFFNIFSEVFNGLGIFKESISFLNRFLNLTTTNIIASKAGPSVLSFCFSIKDSISSGSLITSSIKIFKKISTSPSSFVADIS